MKKKNKKKKQVNKTQSPPAFYLQFPPPLPPAGLSRSESRRSVAVSQQRGNLTDIHTHTQAQTSVTYFLRTMCEYCSQDLLSVTNFPLGDLRYEKMLAFVSVSSEVKKKKKIESIFEVVTSLNRNPIIMAKLILPSSSCELD